MQTWFRDDYGAQTFRATATKCPPRQSVVMRVTMDLHIGEVREDLVVNPSGQQFYNASVPGGPMGHSNSVALSGEALRTA